MKTYENNLKQKSLVSLILKSAIIEIVVTAVFVFIFAAIMFFTESAYNYATVFATAAIAVGSLAAAFYAANKKGQSCSPQNCPDGRHRYSRLHTGRPVLSVSNSGTFTLLL